MILPKFTCNFTLNSQFFNIYLHKGQQEEQANKQKNNK